MSIDYTQLPETLRGGARRYVEHHVPMGAFLTAVASNDLFTAAIRADPINSRRLAEIAYWFYEHAPGGCCGSPGAVRDWVARRELAVEEVAHASL